MRHRSGLSESVSSRFDSPVDAVDEIEIDVVDAPSSTPRLVLGFGAAERASSGAGGEKTIVASANQQTACVHGRDKTAR